MIRMPPGVMATQATDRKQTATRETTLVRKIRFTSSSPEPTPRNCLLRSRLLWSKSTHPLAHNQNPRPPNHHPTQRSPSARRSASAHQRRADFRNPSRSRPPAFSSSRGPAPAARKSSVRQTRPTVPTAISEIVLDRRPRPPSRAALCPRPAPTSKRTTPYRRVHTRRSSRDLIPHITRCARERRPLYPAPRVTFGTSPRDSGAQAR